MVRPGVSRRASALGQDADGLGHTSSQRQAETRVRETAQNAYKWAGSSHGSSARPAVEHLCTSPVLDAAGSSQTRRSRPDSRVRMPDAVVPPAAGPAVTEVSIQIDACRVAVTWFQRRYSPALTRVAVFQFRYAAGVRSDEACPIERHWATAIYRSRSGADCCAVHGGGER